MRSERLADSFSRVALPDSAFALERTVKAARELAEGTAAPAPGTPAGRRILALALAALIAVGFISLTPPGRAAADWVRHLFGGGGVIRQTLGVAESPGGEAYEVKALSEDGDAVCVLFSWVDPPRDEDATHGFGACGSGLDAGASLEVPFAAETGEGGIVFAAVTNLRPSEVGLQYRRAGIPPVDAPVSAYTLDRAVVAAIEAPQTTPDTTFIVGFLPKGVGQVGGPASAELVARDASGAKLASTPVEWTRGGPAGGVVACGGRPSAFESICDAAAGESLSYEELGRELRGVKRGAGIVERAFAAGFSLDLLTPEELVEVTAAEPTAPTERALLDAHEVAQAALSGQSGSYTIDLVRGESGRLVFAADAIRRRNQNRGVTRRETVILVDAIDGEVIAEGLIEP